MFVFRSTLWSVPWDSWQWRQHVSLCANDAFIIGIPWANLFSHSLLPQDHFSRKLRKKPGQHWERNSFAYHNEKNILLGGPLFFKHTNSATAMAVMPWPRYFPTDRLKTHGCNYKAKLVAKSWQNRSLDYSFSVSKVGSREVLFFGKTISEQLLHKGCLVFFEIFAK